MIDLAEHQYPGNQRWQIHASHPHHPGCWCEHQSDAVRAELGRLVGPIVADYLLAAGTLRIELR